jgi:hypothetical protein
MDRETIGAEGAAGLRIAGRAQRQIGRLVDQAGVVGIDEDAVAGVNTRIDRARLNARQAIENGNFSDYRDMTLRPIYRRVPSAAGRGDPDIIDG